MATTHPTSYDEWQHGITVDCITGRLDAPHNPDDRHHAQFLDLYGDDYHAQAVAWFEMAADRQSRPDRVVETDTLVVGAGPQALTVIARWVDDCPDRREEIVVVDRNGRWLDAWDQALEHQAVDVLRSPGVHHPAPEPMAFIWANANANADGGSPPVMTGPLKRPSTAAFRSFCGGLIEQLGLYQLVRTGRVVDVVKNAGGWLTTLDDDETIRARRVV